MRAGSRPLWIVVLAGLWGCPSIENTPVYTDNDNDGVLSDEDCDDGNAAVLPGGTEVCDGVDNDCDGIVDGVDATDPTTWYADGDEDGYGSDVEETVAACVAPDAYTDKGGDCDDSDAEQHPLADEACNGADDDCDGDVDEGDVDDGDAYYADADGDGFGDDDEEVHRCEAPDGYVAEGGDCDDTLAAVNPDATESCNEIDDDCDGAIDEIGSADPTLWFEDGDGDGYGDTSGASKAGCTAPDGYGAAGDCDDDNAAVNPGADERCDALDRDCDGDAVAGAVDATSWYTDGDKDGYGSGTAVLACDDMPGLADVGGDCDDVRPAVNPGADEVCNSRDDDCDGVVDGVESVNAHTWYVDADKDGYGDETSGQRACGAISGRISTGGDCDDTDETISPGSTTFDLPRDGVDQNCDGSDECLDANCDGHRDIVVHASTNAHACSIVFHGGQPTGAPFAAQQTFRDLWHAGCSAGDIGVGDVNGDGYVDFAGFYIYGNPWTSRMAVWYGGRDGATGASTDSGEGATCTSPYARGGIRDLDADGFADGYGYCGSGVGEAYVVKGSADGFDPETFVTLPDAYYQRDMDIADLDFDGYLDVVMTNQDAPTYVYWGSASGYSATARDTLGPSTAFDTVVEDIDLDGWMDLLVTTYWDTAATDPSVYHTDSHIYWGSPQGFSNDRRTALAGIGANGALVGDVDGDTFTDVVLLNSGDADNPFWPTYVYFGGVDGRDFDVARRAELPGWQPLAGKLVDLDADGSLDFVQANQTYPSRVYWGSGEGFDQDVFDELSSNSYTQVEVSDMDRDGFLDVVLGAGGSHVAVHFGSSGGFASVPDAALSVSSGWFAQRFAVTPDPRE